MKKILLISILLLSFFTILTKLEANIVSAGNQDLEFCDFLPCADSQNNNDLDQDVNSAVDNLFMVSTTLVFTGIILLGIYYIVRGAASIIRAEGDTSKVEEGYKKIKGVYAGVAIIIVGIIGIVIVVVFFNNGSIFSLDLTDPTNSFDLPFV